MVSGNGEVPWKEFERVVARIEVSLAPLSATVKLDDHILQPGTGQLRQVDASIRFRVGSVDILITIECRRHKDIQDVTWIEQLAQKRRNVGANATIAVSASGFTGPAHGIAAAENIHLRTLAELQSAEVQDWIRVVSLDLEIRGYTLRRVGIQLYDEVETQLVHDEELMKQCSGRLDQYPLLIKATDNKRFTAFEPIRLAELQGANWFKDCKPGSPSSHNLRWECYDRGICVQTTLGLQPIRYIFLQFETRLDVRKIRMKNVFRYSSGEGPLLEGVEFDISEAIPGAILAIHRDKKTEQTTVKIIQGTEANQSGKEH